MATVVRTPSLDEEWSAGGEAQAKEALAKPCWGCNNTGRTTETIDPKALWAEGGRVSRFANRIPGVNATAGFHDMTQRQLQISFGSVVEATLLVPTMLPTAAITYGGLMANPSAMMLYFNEQQRY